MRSWFMGVGCAAAVALAGCAKEGPDKEAGAGRACMVTGQAEIRGRVYRIQDCVQMGVNMPKEAQAEICQGLADLPGKLGGAKPGKVEYLPRCPLPSQGTCQNAFGRRDMVIHYYQRSGQELSALPLDCGVYGGTYQPAEG